MSDSTTTPAAVEVDARNGRVRVDRRRGFSPYPSLKPSGVECLGDVPLHWAVGPLKYFAALTMGQSPAGSAVQDSPAGLPFLQGCAEFGPDHPAPTQYCLNSPKVAPSGATLMSVRAPVGRINVADQDYGIGRGLCAIQPGPRWHDRFAYWQLHVLCDCLAMFATGSTYDAVSVGDIANLTLWLPLSSEQRAIAAYLDREIAKIDSLIAKNALLIERLKEQRAALIRQTVTCGLPPAESRTVGIASNPSLKPSGVECLGDVPVHWAVGPLKYFAALTMGQSPAGSAVQDSPAGLPFLQGCAEFGPDHPAPTQYCLNSPKVAPSGATLMSVRAPVGRINVADQDYGIGRGLCAIQPGPRWHDRFAYWQLHVLCDCLAMFATGSTYDAVSVSDIANLTLLLPFLSEQRAIADYLDRETAKIDKATTLARQETDLLRRYRTRLISDVVTGKVDVRCLAGAGVEAVE